MTIINKLYLSKAAQEKLADWKQNFKQHESLPSWDDTWMEYANVISKRSHDAQTKVGCVIVNRDNILVSEGYNGFPRGVSNEYLPNLRPAKYLFFNALHSEINAVFNAAREGRSTKGCKAYITGPPCFNCSLALWQSGINEIIHGQQQINMIDTNDEYSVNMEILKFLTFPKLLIRPYVKTAVD
jgi:dCMP deaminase